MTEEIKIEANDLVMLLNELATRRDDYARLSTWLTAHTKVDPSKNSIDSAIGLLETARAMVEHLTPAVMTILTSAISALQSAGVDIPDFPDPDKPSLELATTKELLVELRARGNVDTITQEDPNLKNAGQLVLSAADRLLADLPEPVLSYRAVDEV